MPARNTVPVLGPLAENGRPPDDWIFGLMNQPAQGWHLQSGTRTVFPPLSLLDATIYQALRQAASTHSRIAVGVPRVVTGLTLGPLIYTTLTWFVQQQAGQRIAALPHFRSFPLTRSHPLIVASRSHEIREMWANSALSFNRETIPFSTFRTYRLARTGEFKQDVYSLLAVEKRPDNRRLIKGVPDIVLYDYWPLAGSRFTGRVTGILAELAATDSLTTMQRLLDLIAATHPSWTLVILSLHDIEKRRRLQEEGFAFIAAPYLASVEAEEDASLAPSFTAVEANTPRSVTASWLPLPQDDVVSTSLGDAFQEIATAHREARARNANPELLNGAWYLLNQLSACPVPLRFYEKLRRLDPSQKSLDFRLNRLERVNWQRVPEAVQGLLMVHWHGIVERLRDAYAALENNNPLWWYLAELALYASEPLTLLMSSHLSAQALREALILEFDWSEETSNVTILALSEAHHQTSQPKRIAWVGTWADWQRPLLWGLGAHEVQIVGYPYEALVLSRRLRDIQRDLTHTLPRLTSRVIGQPVSGTLTPILTWDQSNIAETEQAMRRYWRRRAREEAEMGDPWEEEPGDLYFMEDDEEEALYERAAERMAQNSPLPLTEDDDVDEMVSAVRITFRDGTVLLSRADHELMVLPKNKGDAEQRIASQLQSGDHVLVFSAAEHADVFDLALSRTRHLLDIDQRPIELWKQVLRRIRLQYPSDEWGQGARFCKALEGLGCQRDHVTMRTWLTGATMAPRAVDDITFVLRLSGIKNDAASRAKMIKREMEAVRSFHRRIGRRIVQRMQSHGEVPPADLIDAEIDELLEGADLRTVDCVSSPFDSPKSRIAATTIEEDLK